jgi:hypothetical protein
MKSVNTDKEKMDLIKKLLRMYLSKKENILFEKNLGKGLKNWNENDVEYLALLYDIHYCPSFSIGGLDIIPYSQQDEIAREIKANKENALQRLTEEPYASWYKNARDYK